MKKKFSPAQQPTATTVEKFAPSQRQPPETTTSTTFVFASAPPVPSEYAFVDDNHQEENFLPPAAAPRRSVMPPYNRNSGAADPTNKQQQHPPPPYVFGRISHVYDMIDPKSGHEWMFRVALAEFLFAACAASCAVSCIVHVDKYCPYYTGVWVAIVFLINAVLGVIAAKRATVNFFVAHLVSSVLAAVTAIILLALSINNWNHAGYINGELCVFATHDQKYLAQYIWNNDKHPYGQCVYDFKLGLTLNVVLMICAVLEGILSLASTIFCFKAVCRCTSWRYRR